MKNNEKAYKAYSKASKGINVKENEQIVLKSETILSYYFARDIEGADIRAHEQVIIELKHPQLYFLFARDIRGANIEEHFKAILNSGNNKYLDKFIKAVNYKNTKVEEWLLYI